MYEKDGECTLPIVAVYLNADRDGRIARLVQLFSESKESALPSGRLVPKTAKEVLYMVIDKGLVAVEAEAKKLAK